MLLKYHVTPGEYGYRPACMRALRELRLECSRSVNRDASLRDNQSISVDVIGRHGLIEEANIG